jgi:hypothetical protein
MRTNPSDAIETRYQAIQSMRKHWTGHVYSSKQHVRSLASEKARNDHLTCMVLTGLVNADFVCCVEPDIASTVATSSKTIPLDFHLDSKLLPAQHGWLWMHDPLLIPITGDDEVIKLRREERQTHENIEHNETNWACRWLVRGHWRRQWHPSTGQHVPKWILPYVKGPDGAPLKPPTETVYSVCR